MPHHPVSAQTARRWELREETKTAALLDALVRNTRGEDSPAEMAERLIERWRETPNLHIEVRPTRLLVNDVDIDTSSQGCSWTHFAFMSGLRSVGLTAETGAADIQRLAQRLAQLRLDIDAAQRFRDWAWEEDGEGLQLVVTRTFSEVFEQASPSFDGAVTTLTAVRGEPALPLGEGVLADPQDLDRAALRPEYEVSLLDYQTRAERREHEITASLLRDLGDQANTTFGWAIAEFKTLVASPTLRQALPPARVARRVVDIWSGPKPHEAARILTQLRTLDLPYAQRVEANLTVRSIATALLHNEHASLECRQDALHQWLDSDDDRAADVLRQIVARSSDEEAAVDALLHPLLVGPRAPRVLHALSSPELSPLLAAWLSRRIEAANLGVLIEGLTPRSQAAALAERSPQDLHLHMPRLLALLDDESIRAHMTEAFVTRPTQAAAMMVGEIIRVTAAKPWRQRLAVLACHRVHDAPQGTQLLVRLAASRRTDDTLRVAALNGLRTSPSLLEQAARWSWSELFAAPVVRAALREARRSAASS